ncbi:hypothetical protein MAXJ12_24082 [Mesorhizobium alhagi CCNWXJ12-2]|uniref:Uncharacterized protein n=1 Tax=Mesorhizobium alhagi CCNWXJ12-2 TaxID=1107882 RepID=H0HX97_9HYPH|nr:hypothetical protein MAXJ12_24082 [Mesorhizobium alhagi CCNWXJ12-2]
MGTGLRKTCADGKTQTVEPMFESIGVRLKFFWLTTGPNVTSARKKRISVPNSPGVVNWQSSERNGSRPASTTSASW